ncbi:UNVERIFIED_CONTAM: hypothetical protein HDU68_009564 [Siphonaria sp. JEL0065]|nr:hypothetical protein HDU68_009564 [Siphonaria sp. JEL0065]
MFASVFTIAALAATASARFVETSEFIKAAPAGGALVYKNGPVLANIEVFVVYYGADATFQNETNAFYAGIVSSSLMTMMSQYSTPTQSIGKGKFIGSYVQTTNVKKNLVESDIGAIVANLVNTGIINPNSNYYVPVHLAPSVLLSGQCSSFCAFHDSVSTNKGRVSFGMMPDTSVPSCLGKCGVTGKNVTPFETTCVNAAHELSEAVTDPQPSSGWVDKSGNEIGDLCNPTWGYVTGADGNSYLIQGEWSNSANSCWLGDVKNPGTTATSTTTTTKPSPTTATTTKAATSATKTTTTTTIVGKSTSTTTTKQATTAATGVPVVGQPCTGVSQCYAGVTYYCQQTNPPTWIVWYNGGC